MSIYHVSPKASNVKTGPIVVTTSSADTCPEECPFKDNGCYAGPGSRLWKHWSEVTNGKGHRWAVFLTALKVALLATRYKVWRHNQAGDLPTTRDGRLNPVALSQLATVSRQTGVRGFTYTHHELELLPVDELRRAADRGFVANISCETEAKADRAKAWGLQAALVLPSSVAESVKNGGLRNWKTRGGNTVVVCPAYYDKITCAECKLCASNHPKRAIVGFPAHGVSKKKVDRLLLELEVKP